VTDIAFAFIFARGGSKGLPGKNIKHLNGKPLLAYSITSAKACERIKDVFVSTDDEDIAKVAIEYGAKVIIRPEELAQDTSPEWLAWQHAIAYVKEKYEDFTYFISLPVTSPLRDVCDIENALDKLIVNTADICISVTQANRSPYFNMVVKDNGICQLVNQPSDEVTRRQDAPAVFDITTVVYASTPGFILTHSKLFDGKVTAIEVPKARAVDIDDIYDFYLAEAILKAEQG